MTQGIVLFAHGARDPRWAAPFEAVATRLRERAPGAQVRLAYLELMTPDLPTAGADLAASGCTDVVVLPLFLGAGGHVRKDLPQIIDTLRAAHPAVRWSLQPPVGELPAVIDAMAGAAVAALASATDRGARLNLHQFRYVREAVRRGLNLTEAAKALHTSQPGVSKAILELEEELGVRIFQRHGKRLRRVTEPGTQVLASIERILQELENLRRIGEEYSRQESGTLSIATTHTQARYMLPAPIAALRQRYPAVRVALHQGNPEQVAQMLLDGAADIGLATESLEEHADLITLPCYDWQHVAVVPAGHPLADGPPPTLEQLAAQPLVSYHPSFTGRRRIDQAFAQRRLAPDFVLEAIDADVIKTYVRLGLGVGLVAEMAMRAEDAAADDGLVARPVGHLFGRNVSRVAFRRGAYLRHYVYTLAELLSDRLNRALIERAVAGGGDDYAL